MPTSGCSLDSTPETVDVEITNNTYTIDSAAITPTVAQVSPTEVLVSLQSDVADFQNINCYFTDNPANPIEKTVSPPPDPGWIEKVLGTDVAGLATLTVINLAANDSWYLVIQGVNGVLVISDAITIGV